MTSVGLTRAEDTEHRGTGVSLHPPRVDSVATTSTCASLSDAVHTSSAVTRRPVPPLSPADTNANFE
ncbi:hypothetical protein FB451DRAFT_1396557 [Mycena latifolia]|nr:hypothetical protein FB451DRAFT_1396557 [Mycena latifolia]